MSETDYQKNKSKKKSVVQDLVPLIGCWLDGGISKCELIVDCRKGAEFKQTKRLVQHTSYDISIQITRSQQINKRITHLLGSVIYSKLNNMLLETRFKFHANSKTPQTTLTTALQYSDNHPPLCSAVHF